MSPGGERIGYRIWSPVQRDDQILLKAYFADYLWESSLVGGSDAAPPTRELEAWEWINGHEGSESAGFFACASYPDLLDAVDLEGRGLGVHGAVALSGELVGDEVGVIRAQTARIIGFRDELPCWTCLEADEWRAGIVSVFEPVSGVGSGCEKHAAAEIARADSQSDVMATAEVLLGLAVRYEVPLMTHDDLLSLEAA